MRLLMALLFAVILWAYINSGSSDIVIQEINNVPVTFTGTDELASRNLVILDSRTYYVNLRIKGSDRNLNNVNRSEISAEIDLSTITQKGPQNMKVIVRGLSNSVILETVTPSTIQLNVDSIEEIQWDVSVITDGRPAGDYAVISAKTTDKVQISGPSELLSQAEKVVANVNVQGISEDSVQHVSVNAVDGNGEVISEVSCTPSVVDVDVVLGKTKEVEVIAPSTTGQLTAGFQVTKVSVDPAVKTVGAKEDVLATITSLPMEAIDVSGASKDITQEVNLKLPDGASFLDDSDNKVLVTVTIEPVIERNFSVTNVEVRNLKEGLTVAKMKDASVSVKLTGVSSELSDLDLSEISAYVDLSGKEKGEHSVDIKIDSPKGKVVSVSPSKTAVTIE